MMEVENNIEECLTNLIEEIEISSEASGDTTQECFFNYYNEISSENGDTIDLAYEPVRKEGKGGYQVDGYALDEVRGELHLAITDYNGEKSINQLNADGMESLFKRANSFVEKSINNEFINSLEESSPAFQVAFKIKENQSIINRIRILLMTDKQLSTRKKEIASVNIIGKPVTYSVLDINRLSNITKNLTGNEKIEIDIEELNHGKPLPCLEAHITETPYKSYLVVLPGNFLTTVYAEYGARLLEQNVRVFLQARGEVNKGLIETAREEPEMFFAYNNGLTAIASDIEIIKSDDGSTSIRKIKDLQIVNGGQTTAALLYAKDREHTDLKNVFVQMKLSVIDPDEIEEIVPNISKFANTQNKVLSSDLFSSHPFNNVFEKHSRNISAPPLPGQFNTTKWFYERLKGQYQGKTSYSTSSEKKKFLTENPKNQLLTKRDIFKFKICYDKKPFLASRGAEAVFKFYSNEIASLWDRNKDIFDENYFKDTVSQAILFKTTDRIVGKSEWYINDRSNKSEIVYYTISLLIHHLNTSLKSDLDLKIIWSRQEISEEVCEVISLLAKHVSILIKDTPPDVGNIREYAKKEECWHKVMTSKLPKISDMKGFLVNSVSSELSEALDMGIDIYKSKFPILLGRDKTDRKVTLEKAKAGHLYIKFSGKNKLETDIRTLKNSKKFGVETHNINLSTAIDLLDLSPRVLGQHPTFKEDIEYCIGKRSAYLNMGENSYSIKEYHDFRSFSLNDAINIIDVSQ